MSAARARKQTRGEALIEAAGTPARRKSYRCQNVHDANGPLQKGRREIVADGGDDSGIRKGLAAVLDLSWCLGVLGGSIRRWEAKVAARQAFEQEQLARTGKALPQLTLPEAEWIEAAKTWSGQDMVALAEARDQAKGALESVGQRIDQYRRGGLPVPLELQDRLLAAESEMVRTREAYREGRDLFDALGVELQKATAGLHQAAGGSLRNMIGRAGHACRKLMPASQRRLFHSFPNRAPDAIRAEHAKALRCAHLVGLLNGTAVDAMEVFWNACGSVAEIVEGKVNAGGSVVAELKIAAPGAALDRELGMTT